VWGKKVIKGEIQEGKGKRSSAPRWVPGREKILYQTNLYGSKGTAKGEKTGKNNRGGAERVGSDF